MSIFHEMHPARTVNPGRDYSELKRMIAEAIERGHVEVIPVMRKNRWSFGETWYREAETGVIFSLTAPGDRPGWWEEIDANELSEGQQIQ